MADAAKLAFQINFPNADEHGAVALYVLVTVAISALYTFWMRRSENRDD